VLARIGPADAWLRVKWRSQNLGLAHTSDQDHRRRWSERTVRPPAGSIWDSL